MNLQAVWYNWTYFEQDWVASWGPLPLPTWSHYSLHQYWSLFDFANDKCIMKKPMPRSSLVFVVIAGWPRWKCSLWLTSVFDMTCWKLWIYHRIFVEVWLVGFSPPLYRMVLMNSESYDLSLNASVWQMKPKWLSQEYLNNAHNLDSGIDMSFLGNLARCTL